MADLPLVGGHAPGISSKADSETCVNLFIEPDSTGKGGYLVSRPGYTEWDSTAAPDSSQTITTLVGASTTATATVALHGYETGDSLDISGAAEVEFNVAPATITVTDINTFTYAKDAGVSPAGGTPVCITTSGDYAKEVRCLIRDMWTGQALSALAIIGNRIYVVNKDGVLAHTKTWPRLESMYGPVAAEIMGEQQDDGFIISDGVAATNEGVTANSILRTGAAYDKTTLSVESNTVAYLDGYLIRDDIDNTGRFVYSDVYLATAENPFNFATAEGAPDDVTAVLTDRREIWLFGEYSTEVWFNAGGKNLPFQRFQGGYVEIGIVAPLTAKRFDNSVVWLAQDRRGSRTVVRAGEGFQPTKISTTQIDKILEASKEYLFNAYALVFRLQGHEFYCLTIPGVSSKLSGTVSVTKVTLVFDSVTKKWFKWKSSSTNHWMPQAFMHPYDSHKRNFGTGYTTPGTSSNQLIVGGTDGTGKLYTLDLDTYTDNGTAIDVERILSPLFGPDNARVNAGPVELETDMDAAELGTAVLSYAKDGKTFNWAGSAVTVTNQATGIGGWNTRTVTDATAAVGDMILLTLDDASIHQGEITALTPSAPNTLYSFTPVTPSAAQSGNAIRFYPSRVRTLTATSSRFMWKRIGRARRWIFKLTASTTSTLPIKWLRLMSKGLGQ